MYRMGRRDAGGTQEGAAAKQHQRLCAEEAEGETAVGPQCAEVADHQQTGLVAGPVCSPCTYPSATARYDERYGSLLLWKYSQ